MKLNISMIIRTLLLLTGLLSTSTFAFPDMTLPKLDKDFFTNPPQVPNAVPNTPTADDKNLRAVSGGASKGPLADATVNVYEVDDLGFAIGSPVATTTTDAGGNFSVSLPTGSSIYLIETKGGSYVDESDTNPDPLARRRITLSPGEGLMSVIREGQTSVALTPFTHALVERARVGARLGGFSDVFAGFSSEAATGFGFDLVTTVPADPISPAADTSAAQKQYALLLGAVANITNVIAIQLGVAQPTFEIIEAVVRDLTDGELDGLQYGATVTTSRGALPSNLGFDQQLRRYRNNNYLEFGDTSLPTFENADEIFGLSAPPVSFVTQEVAFPFEGIFDGINQVNYGKIELANDGTGTFSDREGSGKFLWAAGTDTLTLDFTPFGSKLNSSFTTFVFNSVTFLQEEVQVSYYLEHVSLSMKAIDGTRQLADLTQVIRSEEFNVEQNTTTSKTTQESIDAALVGSDDVLVLTLDEVLGTDNPALPTLVGDPVEVFGNLEMQFEADNTGVVVYTGVTFSWLITPDGYLEVTFSNGHNATYYALYSEGGPRGDYAAVDYFDGTDQRHYGSTIIFNFADLVWDPATVAGFYENNLALPNGDFYQQEYMLLPDGTGIEQGYFAEPESNGVKHFHHDLGMCWAVNEEGRLVLRMSLITDNDLGRGPFPTPEFCASLPQEEVSFLRLQDLYDIRDTTAGDVRQYIGEYTILTTFLSNSCGFDPQPGQNCVDFEWISTQPQIFKHTSLTATPTITIDDNATTSVSQQVIVDLLANDIPGDLEVASVELSSPPSYLDAQGSLLLDSGAATLANSTLTYTPDSSNVEPRFVFIGYRVLDVEGNRSNNGTVTINIQ